jgi:hypothetical protein
VIEEGDLMILLGAERDLDRIREIDVHGKQD